MFSTLAQRLGFGAVAINTTRAFGRRSWMLLNKATKSPKTICGDFPFARSFAPAYTITSRGSYGKIMRSAKCTESASSEPPNPRLTTGKPGKSVFKLDQNRMLELPTKTMHPFGGGLVRSLASKAAMSFSHFLESRCATELVGTCASPGLTQTTRKPSRTNLNAFRRIFINLKPFSGPNPHSFNL